MIRSILFTAKTPPMVSVLLMSRYSPFGVLPHEQAELEEKELEKKDIKNTKPPPQKASSQSKPPP